MATTLSNDISKFLLAGLNKYFTENWETWPTEYSLWTKVVSQDKLVGLYQNIGNIPSAEVIGEGNNIPFGVLSETVQTSLSLDEIGVGISFTLKATKGDLYSIVSDAQKMELMRALKDKMEQMSIKPYDDAFDVNQADGVPMCSLVKPCLDSGDTYLTKLNGGGIIGAAGAANIKTAIQYMSVQKNAQGRPFPARPDVIKTHAYNQMDVEAVFGSQLVPFTTAATQTQNTIPRMKAAYSHYIGQTDYWFLEDSRVDHVISAYKNDMPTPETAYQENFHNADKEARVVFLWGSVSLPNPAVVGSSGA